MFFNNTAKLSNEISVKAQGIHVHVHQVCTFGAGNIGATKQATVAWEKLCRRFGTLYDAILENRAWVNQKLTQEEKSRFKKFADTNVYKKPVLTDNNLGVYSRGDFKTEPKINALKNNIDILDIIAKTYDFKNLGESLDVKDFYSLFASLLSHEMTKMPTQSELLKEVFFIQHYEANNEFKDKDFRKAFVDKTINDVKKEMYNFGYGNCALMADTAFLEAISLELNEDVTYLRFISSTIPNADVVNCIALGPWPTPGCLIIVPWGTWGVIQWNGNIENTPEITKIYQHLNDCKVIFRADIQQQETIRQALENADYQNWSKLHNMQDTVRNITDTIVSKLQALMQSDISENLTLSQLGY